MRCNSAYTARALSIALVAGMALSGCKQQKVQSAGPPPAVPVSVARVAEESVPLEVRAVGTVEASSTVQVKSQIAGQLLRVHFAEGQNVEKGALLLEIDSRPYREALRQAEAAVVRDQAQLRQAEATLARERAQSKNADAEAARYDELTKAGVMSKSQYDQVRTSAEVYRESAHAAEAAIESTRAALESDRAAIERARLDLGYCEIRAPISGRTGNLLVHAGNLVKANDSALVVINQVTPVFVSFSIPEQHLGAVRRLGARRTLGVRAFTEDAPDRAASGRTASGRLSVVDNTVDTATGTVRLKAVFDNRDALLWPGQFVNAVLELDTQANATVVPAEAVQNGQQGQFVYVVKQDQSIEPRPVTPGRAVNGKMVIAQGVAPGETVVTDGHLRLYPGARIQAVDPGKLRDPLKTEGNGQ